MTGSEWVVEAYGCDPVRLTDLRAMRALFAAMVQELALHPVGEALWHRFPGPGGITGMLLLAESHLAVHTFPEHASVCINLFCCTARERWDWETRLLTLLGATRVHVRVLLREYASAPGEPLLHVPLDASLHALPDASAERALSSLPVAAGALP
jgi:S-adenosylmethionine decarboxylase